MSLVDDDDTVLELDSDGLRACKVTEENREVIFSYIAFFLTDPFSVSEPGNGI